MESEDNARIGRVRSHIAYLHGAIHEASSNAIRDGETLVEQCLEQHSQISNREHFPPCLFILLASPSYLDQMKANQLVAGAKGKLANVGLANVAMIGTSVGGVVYENEVHPKGALLVCLASRLSTVTVGLGLDARNNPTAAVAMLFKHTKGTSLAPGSRMDLNPLGHYWFLTFLPGYRKRGNWNSYVGPALHHALIEYVMGRFAIVGGVSSPGDKICEQAPMQFANWEVYEDAIVGAFVEAGTPMASSLPCGFTEIGVTLGANQVSEDRQRIMRFSQGEKVLDEAPVLVLKRYGPRLLLGELSAENKLLTVVPTELPDGTLQVHRQVRTMAAFTLLKPDGPQMRRSLKESMEIARERVHLTTPAAAFLVCCMGLHRHGGDINVALDCVLQDIARSLPNATCLGALFDGEIGQDRMAHSTFANWSIVPLIFGDELLQRTLIYKGCKSLGEYGPKLLAAATFDELVDHCVELVFATGYPGAMLSLVYHDHYDRWIVATSWRGEKFHAICDETRRPLADGDLLWRVFDDPSLRYIKSLSQDPWSEKNAVAKAGLVSQYVFPLRNRDGEPIAVLQIDLGDVSDRLQLEPIEENVLQSLCKEIGAALDQFLAQEQLRIARELDKALTDCMSEPTLMSGLQRYIEIVVKTFRVAEGHIRFWDPTTCRLDLRVGVGTYYALAKAYRPNVPLDDPSQTARVFRESSVGQTRVTVMNRAENDPNRLELLKPYANNSDMVAALSISGSFAVTSFLDVRGNPSGIIHLSHDKTWCFNQSQVASLGDLSSRLSLLVEHLLQKERERNAKTESDFLVAVGPRLWQKIDIANPRAAIDEAVSCLCSQFHATVASLFLWDSERQGLILKAQSGWAATNFIDKAGYAFNEGWTGALRGNSVPVHVRGAALSTALQLKYMEPMFGGALSPGFMLEAVGMPLNSGRENIGVLTLHKRIPANLSKAGTSLFQPGLSKLLEAQECMAFLINLLLSREQGQWQHEEQEKRDAIFKTILNEPFYRLQESLTKAVCEEYCARAANLYLSPCDRSDECFLWKQQPPSNVWNLNSRAALEPKVSDALVIAAQKSAEVEVEGLLSVVNAGRMDWSQGPGVVKRACVPLTVDFKAIGVLEITWDESVWLNKTYLITRFGREHLKKLGLRIGSLIRRNQLIDDQQRAHSEASNSKRAFEAMSAFLLQANHRVAANLVSIQALTIGLRNSVDTESRLRSLNRLDAIVENGKSINERLKGAAVLALDESRESLFLRTLVVEAVGTSLAKAQADGECSLTLANSVDSSIVVIVNRMQMIECFVNIVDNALHAICTARSRGAGGLLSITSQISVEERRVTVVIADDGEGMTSQQKNAAMRGAFRTTTSKGIGVLISILFADANGGRLDITTNKWVGTSVFISLPMTMHTANET